VGFNLAEDPIDIPTMDVAVSYTVKPGPFDLLIIKPDEDIVRRALKTFAAKGVLQFVEIDTAFVLGPIDVSKLFPKD
jgi:hypothetical protein